MYVAAQNGHDLVVKLLLEAGAQKSCLDLARMTALHHACSQPQGNEVCVKLLLGEEKPGKGEESQNWVNARDISGCTPLLYCLNNKNRVLEKVRLVQCMSPLPAFITVKPPIKGSSEKGTTAQQSSGALSYGSNPFLTSKQPPDWR